MRSDSSSNSSERCSAHIFIDDLLVTILNCIIILTNSCNTDFLEKICNNLVMSFLHHLKKLWSNFVGKSHNYERIYDHNGIKYSDLAETIFRFSINSNVQCFSSLGIERSIFGCQKSNIMHFILNNWEKSLYLFARSDKPLKDDLFTPLIETLKPKSIDAILRFLLGKLVSCPPIISDELDILAFLKDVKGQLGLMLVYDQDIRMIKTNFGITKKEEHFCKESSRGEILGLKNLEEAYFQGFTIAMRGVEYRSKALAMITDQLAILFGQPSVGANMYLTPPNSQGLARHYDDHCVFVCQILGTKQWTAFPGSREMLPRLYEPLNCHKVDEICKPENIFLNEGDILYIPRGFFHEAHTYLDADADQVDESATFSLHLTLAIEIEPPFEWEGYVHTALHCWSQKWNQKQTIHSSIEISNLMSVNLLHVSIRLIGHHEPLFKKACLVCASSLSPSYTDGSQDIQDFHRATFNSVLVKINTHSNFMEAFKVVEAAVNMKSEEPLQWMKWLRHLPLVGDVNRYTDFSSPLNAFEGLIHLDTECKEEIEATFLEIKNRFCTEVEFEDASKTYEMLLNKYRMTRKQYVNGMLALHEAG